MSNDGGLDALIAWAVKRLELAAILVEGGATKRKPAALPKLAKDSPLALLATRFALAPVEVEIVALAWAAEESLAVASMVRGLSGASLTVAVVRAALRLDAARTDEVLDAGGALRRLGWIAAGGIPGGQPAATDSLTLAPGIAARLDGRVPDPARLAAGVTRVEERDAAGPGDAALAALVRDEVLSGDRALSSVAIGGVGPADGMGVARLLAQRARRTVLFIDGVTVAAMGLGLASTTLAALRRESVLQEMPLVVSAAASLAGAVVALLAPACGDVSLPIQNVLLDEAAPLGDLVPAGVRVVRRARSGSPGSDSPGAASSKSEPTPPRVMTPYENELDSARRKAARDAARALGQGFDLYPEPMPPPLQAAATAPAPGPPRPSPRVPDSAAGARPVEAPPASEPAVVLAPAVRVEAVAPVEESTASQSASPASAAPGASTEPTSPVAPPAAEDAAPEAAAPDPDEARPFIDVPASATGLELLQYVSQAANPLQRAELLRRLSAQGRDLQIASCLRAHVKVDHPKVRAAAEEGMAKLFGPNWNKTRPITKPVQPPSSES